MATPNDSGPPKKPQGTPPGKEGAGKPPAGKPPAPGGKPAGTPPAGNKPAGTPGAKPTAEAIQLVPETMASVYKVLPLTFKDGALTVVMGDPSNLAALDDLRNFLGIKEVVATLAPAKAIEDAIAKQYAGKEESIIDI